MTTISPVEPMMTPMQVAEYISKAFSVSKRHVYDRWVHFPGFPKPRLLPTAGKIPRKRYVKAEIDQWMEAQK